MTNDTNNAPRVTLSDIEGAIVSEWYFTGAQGVAHYFFDSALPPTNKAQSLHLLTFCVLVLDNGFTVTGESACASPENFDSERGRQIARQKAVDKVWPLLGFRLRDRIAGIG